MRCVAVTADVNCDLYISTLQVLRPLFDRGLVVPGTLISYDDWFLFPTVLGGERSKPTLMSELSQAQVDR
jgi:hypothetical protein